jgi:osmotically-inducible protein OsmY
VGVIKWVLALPFRLLALAIILPIKLVLGTLKLTVKTSFVTTRAALRSSLISFAAGVGLGWFLTSTPTGRQLVEQVRDLVNGAPSGPVDDDQLTAQVRTELASSTRTWHLPQPEVAVSGGMVTLTGSVPHETGRSDLEIAAGSVRGVVSVANHVQVDDGAGATEAPATEGVSA